jgi:hypothetical protein
MRNNLTLDAIALRNPGENPFGRAPPDALPAANRSGCAHHMKVI